MGEQPEAPLFRERSPVPTDGPPPHGGRCNLLLVSVLSFCLIGFGLAVLFAGKRYREEYAQSIEGWRVGSTRLVEITLVKEDRRNIACASDQVIAGLRCGYGGDLHEARPLSSDSQTTLQPYNTVGNELMLAAGLWTSSELKGPLPQDRFTVQCSYRILGVLRSASVRFHPAAAFAPVTKTLTVGTLTDCTLPR